mmetsp:Transcript_111122/g.346292  ORF Transcript_111122/g.346292 Transcript_111122/m.346292 type:complete len:311 (+) Transcript_111122:434-1366(+)
MSVVDRVDGHGKRLLPRYADDEARTLDEYQRSVVMQPALVGEEVKANNGHDQRERHPARSGDKHERLLLDHPLHHPPAQAQRLPADEEGEVADPTLRKALADRGHVVLLGLVHLIAIDHLFHQDQQRQGDEDATEEGTEALVRVNPKVSLDGWDSACDAQQYGLPCQEAEDDGGGFVLTLAGLLLPHLGPCLVTLLGVPVRECCPVGVALRRVARRMDLRTRKVAEQADETEQAHNSPDVPEVEEPDHSAAPLGPLDAKGEPLLRAREHVDAYKRNLMGYEEPDGVKGLMRVVVDLQRNGEDNDPEEEKD